MNVYQFGDKNAFICTECVLKCELKKDSTYSLKICDSG